MGYIAKDKEINLLYQEAEKMFRRLVEDSREGIYMADAKGNLFYVNDSFVQILGYQKKDEVLGLNLAKNLYVKPEDRDGFLRALAKNGFVRDYVVHNKLKDGTTIILSVTSNYIRNDKEKIIGIEGVVHDITKQKEMEEKMDVFIDAIEQMADHVMITDVEGNIEYVNPAFEKTTGYPLGEVVGRNASILKSGKHGRDYYEELWTTILSGKVFYAQTTNKNKRGELYVSDQTISSIKDKTGKITHFISVWKDITEKTRLQEKLDHEKLKLEEIVGFDEKVSRIRKFDKLVDFVVHKTAKILEAQKCSLMIIDHHDNRLCLKGMVGLRHDRVSQAKINLEDPFIGKVAFNGEPVLVKYFNSDEKIEGISSQEFLGQTFMVVPIKMGERLIGVLTVADKAMGSSSEAGSQKAASAKEGEASGQKEHIESFTETDLKVLCTISREVAVAIENVRLYKELNYLTVIDPLTRIYNYRHFTKALDHEIMRSHRFKRPLTLLMVDVDDFKSYNDEFGHLEGDELLKSISHIFKNNLREIDVVCRYAGDEFVIILPETDVKGAEMTAKKIKKAVEKNRFKKKVTLSVGLTKLTVEMTRHDFIRKADMALYQAKREGKNKVCSFT